PCKTPDATSGIARDKATEPSQGSCTAVTVALRAAGVTGFVRQAKRRHPRHFWGIADPVWPVARKTTARRSWSPPRVRCPRAPPVA
ncbi:MAG: hypothetical protein KC657_22255, partial [Myxococcales bacterium]|nr:hypothetical protein [Myxococcales bacterium]